MGLNTESIEWFAPAMEKVLETGEKETPGDSLDALLDCLGYDNAGISEYWRKNRSHHESAELANVLGALRKVAGHIGENVGRIEWSGMTRDEEGDIVLDPALVMKKYPVPYRKIDYLVGLVSREALHRTEWSDLLWMKVDQKGQPPKAIDRIVFQKIVHTGEEIFVDLVSNRSILGLYTQKVRRVFIERARQLLKPGVTTDELVLLWWEISFSEASTPLPKTYKAPLDILGKLSARLEEVSASGKGPTERSRLRADLYLETWEAIKETIRSLKVIDKTLCWYPSRTGAGGKKGDAERKKRSSKKLSNEMVRDVELRLAANSSDITPIIRSVVGEENKDIVPMSKWDFNIASHPIIDIKLVARLKAIFQHYSERKTVLNRGLDFGRIDRRRLYRAPISGRCFYDKQKIPVLDWNICLLIDASGSMQGPKWRTVQDTVGTIYTAFRGFRNRLQVYGYFEVEGVGMISRLIDGKKLLSVPPSGQTASGQAIIAAAYFMPKDTRKKFLIHITDGQSNYGCGVKYGIRYCKAQNIHLVTLGVAYKDREAMGKQYGNAIQFLDYFTQLPGALEQLLKWTLL